MIEKLSLEEKFSLQIARLYINFSSELHNITKNNELFRIPNEEGLCIKAVGLLHDVRFYQAMVRNFLLTILRTLGFCIWLINNFSVLCIVVIRIGIVNFIVLLVKDLKLHEVEALLDKVYISKMFQV